MTLATCDPVTFIITSDRLASIAFYRDMLGLPLVAEDAFAAVFDLNGIMLRISQVSGFKGHDHTVLGWPVEDIAATATALKAKGVTFKIYPGFGQDENGVWSVPASDAKVAWFSDPDGNILSITQF